MRQSERQARNVFRGTPSAYGLSRRSGEALSKSEAISSGVKGESHAIHSAVAGTEAAFKDCRVSISTPRSYANSAPFLLQTYRRDMGSGNIVVTKEVDAPIVVQGKHWGGLRLAFKF